MKVNNVGGVRVEVLGNDGVHEWGRTHYEDGTIINWTENLQARREFEAAIRDELERVLRKDI